jgi:hypothetical protein
MKTRAMAAFVAPLVLALAACAPSVPSSPPLTGDPVVGPTVAGDPVPAVPPGPVEADTMLIVKATATAANGATLALELRVHKSTTWDDVAAQTLPAALTATCPDLTASLFEQKQWGFTRANLTAVPSDTAAGWPADGKITLRPSAEKVDMAGRGILLDSGDNGCQNDKSFAGQGNGAFAIGIAGDATDGSDTLRGWATHSYGFVVDPDTAALSECSVTVTDLGKQFGGGSGWSQSADGQHCVVGPVDEKPARK